MCCAFNSLENVSNSTWNNTSLVTLSTLHCMCLTCTSLTISKNSSIISLQYWLNNRKGSVIKDWLLFACWSEDRIKCEITNTRKVGLFRVGIFYSNSTLIFKNLDNNIMIGLSLFWIWWSTTNDDFYRLCFWWSFDFWWHLLIF